MTQPAPPTRTLEQMIADDPTGTAFALKGFMASAGNNATVADWRAKIDSESTEIGRAFYDWFRRQGFESVLDRVDVEQRAIWSRSGSELDFDDWARDVVARMEPLMAQMSQDPQTLHKMEQTMDAFEREHGRVPTEAEIIIPICEEYLGPDWSELVRIGIQFGQDVQEALSETVAAALESPRLRPVDSPPAPPLSPLGDASRISH